MDKAIALLCLLLAGCNYGETPAEHRERMMLACQDRGSNALDCVEALNRINPSPVLP